MDVSCSVSSSPGRHSSLPKPSPRPRQAQHLLGEKYTFLLSFFQRQHWDPHLNSYGSLKLHCYGRSHHIPNGHGVSWRFWSSKMKTYAPFLGQIIFQKVLDNLDFITGRESLCCFRLTRIDFNIHPLLKHINRASVTEGPCHLSGPAVQFMKVRVSVQWECSPQLESTIMFSLNSFYNLAWQSWQIAPVYVSERTPYNETVHHRLSQQLCWRQMQSAVVKLANFLFNIWPMVRRGSWLL